MEVVKRPRGRPSEGAREAVIEAARELFMERDYGTVRTAEILERAGVSRGALYHHFDGKRDLYREVWLESERRLVGRLAEAASAAESPFKALTAGCLAYLDESATNRELQRIGLLQSRTVLGWEDWRQGIQDLGLRAVGEVVSAAIQSGEIRKGNVETTAHLVLAALIEAGLLIATADDQRAARAAAEPVLKAMLEGLRGSGAGA